ncbi:leucyl/phenylalanyl-tRNA--protein transferase [Aquabacterium sp.]|uniref:leucyl/phenylalanyl-tRNA--protein transferase n=1 Tax=Aquabacterium sp. TaxID=1872578 RepID=UPI002B885BB1|nr:leucyl/phenylalanyl-tRNA--protein transferase [Aquabacterium sp.]HSW07658.1 leucyl/phenylalanyl-tRNA--protein transferase [Aquabacterium sp.]
MSSQNLLWIDDTTPLPPTRCALGPDSDAPGLLAAGGRVTPQRLEEAYRAGVFPWYSPGQPTLWWSPDPRMVLPVAEFRLSASLRKTLRKFLRTPGCEIRIDTTFRRVMRACAGTPRAGQQGTWIVPELIEAYCAWHAKGRAHSVETWIDGELVGGLYGVGIGGMFYGESMFAHRTDASKIALAALVAFCRAHGITLIDCQQHTGHLASFGAREIPRATFEAHLARALGAPSPPAWTYHPRLWAQLGIVAEPPAQTPGAFDGP